MACENRFAALTHDDQSCGNSELDAREQLDTNELHARLKMATEARTKKVCVKVTPVKQTWDKAQLYGGSMHLAEEFDAQESDSEEDSIPDLEDVVVLEDESHSGTDSEYWAAVVDSDLSDASVQTDGSESSDSDFH